MLRIYFPSDLDYDQYGNPRHQTWPITYFPCYQDDYFCFRPIYFKVLDERKVQDSRQIQSSQKTTKRRSSVEGWSLVVRRRTSKRRSEKRPKKKNVVLQSRTGGWWWGGGQVRDVRRGGHPQGGTCRPPHGVCSIVLLSQHRIPWFRFVYLKNTVVEIYTGQPGGDKK